MDFLQSVTEEGKKAAKTGNITSGYTMQTISEGDLEKFRTSTFAKRFRRFLAKQSHRLRFFLAAIPRKLVAFCLMVILAAFGIWHSFSGFPLMPKTGNYAVLTRGGGDERLVVEERWLKPTRWSEDQVIWLGENTFKKYQTYVTLKDGRKHVLQIQTRIHIADLIPLKGRTADDSRQLVEQFLADFSGANADLLNEQGRYAFCKLLEAQRAHGYWFDTYWAEFLTY
ncbi:MAG TPA: hypothetical protein VEA59_07180 [Patescibacteria group bacterium]|nr:hypothetical protein [Patescibacteria group bacterium]